MPGRLWGPELGYYPIWGGVLCKHLVANKIYWQGRSWGLFWSGADIVWIRNQIIIGLYEVRRNEKKIYRRGDRGLELYWRGSDVVCSAGVQLQVPNRRSADTLSTLIPCLLPLHPNTLNICRSADKTLKVYQIVSQYSLQVYYEQREANIHPCPI